MNPAARQKIAMFLKERAKSNPAMQTVKNLASPVPSLGMQQPMPKPVLGFQSPINPFQTPKLKFNNLQNKLKRSI